MQNDSGKALTIFLILIAVIFISLTAISVFLLVKQVQLRERAEEQSIQLQGSESTLRGELQEIKKQNEILDFKVKEAEEKIESLLEELDLAQGVRDEVGKENRDLKESLDTVKKTNEEIKAQLAQKEQDAERRVNDLQSQLNEAIERNKILEERQQSLEQEYQQLKEKLTSLQAPQVSAESVGDAVDGQGVDLAPIVVSAADAGQGQVISVDQEAEFVIVNLGERHGAAVDKVLSIYTNDQYVGDVKITRVLPEMSAADFIPPLTSQNVSEGNLVKFKE
jgi:phage shock protein A